MKTWKRVAALSVAVTVTVTAGSGCGSLGNNSAGDFGSTTPSPGGAQGSSGGSPTGPIVTSDAGLPPETKTEGTYRSPVATGQIVWIANPTSGRVAYIDAASLVVQTVAAGDAPTYLAAVPDPHDDVAIVLNVLSHDATLLRDHAGALTSTTFPVTADGNSWAISASGRWALAWTDATRVASPDPTQGFQDVAVLDLSGARKPTILAVGYRPVQVAFSSDESRAFAVTQDGISVVDLLGGTEPTVTKNFPLAATPVPTATDAGLEASADGSGDAAAPDASADSSADSSPQGAPPTPSSVPDVSFTPDGSYALVRSNGLAAISIVSLKDGALTTVSLPSAPTDLTLSPAGDFALAVLRDSATVVWMPIPGIVSDPTALVSIPVPGETVGRAIVTHGGETALLFTTAAPIDRLLVLSFKPSPTYRAVTLHAPILAVFPTADARNAVVLHDVKPAAGSSVKGAFSVVPIGGDLPAKIVGVPAAPTAVALSPASDRALVSIRDDSSGTYGVYLAMMPSLEVLPYTLASPPIAVGIAAAAGRGYVAQDHPEGRITLLDLDAGDARTVTGFELGSRVVLGSHP